MKSLQVCAGHEAGCESFIHAMCTVYENQSAEAVLLVDASNAFNSINRNTFLDNVEIIRPSITRYVKNCYSLSIRLFIIGGGEIQINGRNNSGQSVCHGNLCNSYCTNDSHVSGNKFTKKLQYLHNSIR